MNRRLTDEGLDRLDRYTQEYKRWITGDLPVNEWDLSDEGWWRYVGIPLLVAEVREYRRRDADQKREKGHADGDHRDQEGGSSAPPLQLVKPEQVLPAVGLHAGNVVTKLFVRLRAQVLGICGFHEREESRMPSWPASADLRGQ